MPSRAGSASALSLLLVLATAFPGRAEPIGQVVAQRGAASAVRDGAPRALHLGARVEASDRIRTSAEGRVQIAFADGSSLVLGPASELELTRFELRDGRLFAAVVELLSGILRMQVPTAPLDVVEARGRTAIATVRGTEWIIETGAAKTAVFVLRGTVGVRGTAAGSAVSLHPGEGTDVPAGAPAPSPVRWGEARVREVLALTAAQ
ncbi:hypothetical protein HRbin40_01210 [bacterium HR40]|nr:hypothetical protein HRbin40_01210 [bacterium HR40]